MRIYGYLRASTKEQNANRAKEDLELFAETNQLKISYWFVESESGTALNRPELFRLLEIADPGDIILVEQVDRISRLNQKDWESLRGIITTKGIRIVALDLPTSYQFIQVNDEFTGRMLSAVNSMMLDMLAAIARKDYDDRKRRQSQGVNRAKFLGKYKGRPEDIKLHKKISSLLQDGKSYSDIQDLLGCSRHTISKVNKRLKEIDR